MVTYNDYCDNVARRDRNYTEEEFNNILALFPNLDIKIDWDTFLEEDDTDLLWYIFNYVIGNLNDFSVEDYDIESKSVILCDNFYIKDVKLSKEILEKYGWTISNYEKSLEDAADYESVEIDSLIDSLKDTLNNVSKEHKTMLINKIKELC